MFKIFLSRTVSPGVGISLPATIEEIREAYSLLNGTDTVPLETATAYVESSIPNLRHYLYEVPVTEKRLEELNYLAYRVKWMDSQDEAVFGTVIEMMKPETLQDWTYVNTLDTKSESMKKVCKLRSSMISYR